MVLESLDPGNFKEFLVNSWEYAPWVWDFLILAYLLSNIFDIATRKNDFLKTNKRFVRSLGVILGGLTALVFNQKDISIASSPGWIIFLVCMIFSLFTYQLFKSWFPDKNILCIALSMLLFLFMFSWISAAGKPTYYEQNSALASVISYISEITFFLLIFGMLGAFNSERKGPSTEGLGSLWGGTMNKFKGWNARRKERRDNILRTQLSQASNDCKKTKEELQNLNDLLATLNIADKNINQLTSYKNSLGNEIDYIIKCAQKLVSDIEVIDKKLAENSQFFSALPVEELKRRIELVKKRIDKHPILTPDEKIHYDADKISPLLDLHSDIVGILTTINARNRLLQQKIHSELKISNDSIINNEIKDLKKIQSRINSLLTEYISIKEQLMKKPENIIALKNQQSILINELDTITKSNTLSTLRLTLSASNACLDIVIQESENIDSSTDKISSKVAEINVGVNNILAELKSREKSYESEVDEVARLENLSRTLKSQEKLINEVLKSTVNVVSSTFGEKRFKSYVEGKSVSKGKRIGPSESGKKLVDYIMKKVYPQLANAVLELPVERNLSEAIFNGIQYAMPKIDNISDESSRKNLINILNYLYQNEDKIKNDINLIERSLRMLEAIISEIVMESQKSDVQAKIRDLINQSFFNELIAKETELEKLSNQLKIYSASLDSNIKKIKRTK